MLETDQKTLIGFSRMQKGRTSKLEDVSDRVAMFALQGPKSAKVLQRISSEQMSSLFLDSDANGMKLQA